MIETDLIEFGGRGGDITFLAPDPHKIADQIPLASARLMEDLYEISFEDILDYLAELGERLDIRKNDYLLEAREYSYATAPTTKPIMDSFFHDMPFMFDKERIRGMVEFTIGIPYLESWVSKAINGSQRRAFAPTARAALHIVAGNGPVLGALTILRGAVTRGDTIIKVPSNDPFTTGAIARTMVDMAPDHPITKHLAVAYWRGGDEALESKIYQPHNIEKICAWGGFASVKHVTKYIQPGIELISLDPKRSASIVGGEALENERVMQETANRIATDVATGNQTACSACRMVYVTCGTDDDGVEKLKKLGRLTYEAMLRLPEALTTKPKRYDPELRRQVDTLRLVRRFLHGNRRPERRGCGAGLAFLRPCRVLGISRRPHGQPHSRRYHRGSARGRSMPIRRPSVSSRKACVKWFATKARCTVASASSRSAMPSTARASSGRRMA